MIFFFFLLFSVSCFATSNGTLNFTRSVSNPLNFDINRSFIDYPTGPEIEMFIENNTVYLYSHRENAGFNDDRIYYGNGSSPETVQLSQYLTTLNGVRTHSLARTANNTALINGSYHIFGSARGGGHGAPIYHYSSVDKLSFVNACGVNPAVNANYYNTAVTFDQSSGMWFMLAESPDCGGLDYFTSPNGCDWTMIKSLGFGLNPWMTLSSGVWTVYVHDWNNACGTNGQHIDYYKVTNLSGMNPNNASKAAADILPSIENWSTKGNAADPDVVIVPPDSQQYFGHEWYFLYGGDGDVIDGEQVSAVAYDAPNRTFFTAHNVTENYALQGSLLLSVTGQDAFFNVTSSRQANLSICYGLTTAYGICADNHNYGAVSSYLLSSLNQNATYFYRVLITDRQGSTAIFPDGNFTTAAIPTAPESSSIDIIIVLLCIGAVITFLPVDEKIRLWLYLPVILMAILVLLSLLI